MTETAKYLKTFFEEKEIRQESYELTAPDGMTHILDTDVVIEAIHNAPASEQTQIAAMLRKIDFKNGDVNHFLKFLAQQMVNHY